MEPSVNEYRQFGEPHGVPGYEECASNAADLLVDAGEARDSNQYPLAAQLTAEAAVWVELAKLRQGEVAR